MIHEVDSALRRVIVEDALGGSGVEVAFEAPTKDWASRRNAPTVNAFLYDIREDLRRRSRGMVNEYREDKTVAARRLPPRYIKLSYLLTAWTQRPEDEHRLLSVMLAGFLKHESLPARTLTGSLQEIGLPVPMTVALPPPEDRAFADVWTALGGELKPSLDIVVSAPIDSGRVFPVEEAALREPAFAIPPHWPRIAGLDFGWDHPTAAVWLAWDRDADIVHVTDAYRLREETPLVHAAALRERGSWIPVAWPADGLQHDKGSGAPLAEQYRGHGVNMLHQHAQFPDGSTGFEAGLAEMLDRMKTGRLKVAAHLAEWWQEFRLYHRRDGRVVKEQDDLLSATRYALMMLRFAKTEPRPGTGFSRRIVYPDLGVA